MMRCGIRSGRSCGRMKGVTMVGFLLGTTLTTVIVFAALELLLTAQQTDRKQQQLNMLVDDLRLLVIGLTREIRDAGVDPEGIGGTDSIPVLRLPRTSGTHERWLVRRPATNCLGERERLATSVFSLVNQQFRCGNNETPPINQTLVDGIEFFRLVALNHDGQEDWVRPVLVEIELHFSTTRTAGSRRIWTSQVALRNIVLGVTDESP